MGVIQKHSTIKDILITTGFPRSGNMFLNHALNILFYPTLEANTPWHLTTAIKDTSKILVPFRNPYDAILSWNRFVSPYVDNPSKREDLNADVKFYLRFYQEALKYSSNTVLMDFDLFTKDIDYIKDKVFKNFGIGTDNYVTDAQVKEAMLTNGKDINLPRNNKEELDAVKQQLVNLEGFDQCVELYNQLKSK